MSRPTHRIRTSITVVTALLGLAGLAVPSPAAADGSLPNPGQSIDTGFLAADLAQSLVGPGVEVSGVSFVGDTAARGLFNVADPTAVGFGSGLVMSSGAATDIVGPNRSDSTSTDYTGTGDQDLSLLSGYPTYDAAVLDFDFIPVTNQVTFNYVFASDEYPEWVNTPFNDVFAFFINGTNCAEVRQTAGDPSSPFVAVAVNNINNSNPIQDPPPAPQRPDLFRPNSYEPAGASLLDLELDGITHPLVCQAPVVPDKPNHMKLAIADSSDGIYDSAVFIQAGSLTSNDNPVADLSLWPSAGPAPLPVQAIIEGEDPNGAPLTYTVNWGDGSPDAAGSLPGETAIENHTYAYGGEYLVTLTVSNGTHSGTSVEDVDVFGDAPPPPPVTDTTAPELAPSLSSPSPLLVGAAGVTALPNASDASGIASQSCDPVDTATAGAKTLACSAVDNAGNSASASLAYVVGYGITNVKPAPGATFKRTSGIAVSFQLTDAAGRLSDTAATALRPSVSVGFNGLTPVTPNYDKKSHAYKLTLATNKPPVGPATVTIRVTVGGTTVTTLTIPVTIV